MEQPWLVWLALAAGLLIGAAIATAIVLAVRSGRRAVQVVSPALPPGIAAMLEVIGAPAVLVDPSNQVVASSGHAETAGLVNGQVHGDVLALVSEVREAGERVTRDLALAAPGRRDAVRHLSATAALVGARYVLVVAEDRTESIRLDEVRRDFIANVSHELKTPIGAVSLLAEAVASAADDPERVRRFAEQLSAEAQRLGGLTQDIIELSRVQGAEPLAQSELVGIDAVVAEALEQNRVAAQAKGIDIVGGGTRGLAVFGQKETLITAIHNLIANAVQYSPAHSRVGVGVSLREGVVEIAVSDQGPGISAEEQSRIFERFFRSDPARSRNTGGTGLGLSIVKHAIANHGGEIRVWSQRGQGSTFTICLPAATNVHEEVPA